jgi:hypothetical protein
MAPRTACVVVAAAIGALGCERPKGWQRREVDHALVQVDRDHLHLRTDTVGEGRFASQATFVLVDARNTHSADLEVSLGGDLVDAAGQPVGRLRTESLRVPAGGVRTFALIDEQNQARPAAVAARVDVVGAWAPDYPPPLVVADGAVTRDGDRLVVAGTVHNTADRHVKVIVLAGFYGADGVPLRRPFTLMELAGHTSHPAEFVGPEGATRAYIFIGQYVY